MTYFEAVKLSAHRQTVVRSIRSAVGRLTVRRYSSSRGRPPANRPRVASARDGRADPPPPRRPRRARDAALRVSAPGTRARARRRPPRRPRRPALRRREDGAARRPRPRVVEGGGGAAGGPASARRGRDPELGARRPAASAPPVGGRMDVFVTGGSRGIGRAIALRFA